MSYTVIPSNKEQEEYIKNKLPNKNIDKSGMIFGYLKVNNRNKENPLFYDCTCLVCNTDCIIENRKLTLSGKGMSSCGCKRKGFLGKKKDEKYFDTIDTPEKAYFLGLIAADGTISKSKRCESYTLGITLKRQDREILEKFKKELKSDIEVKDCYATNSESNKQYPASKFRVTNKKICKDLIKYGIIENKTKKLIINWNLIPKQYWRDFIRGYIDGDGCYYICRTKTGRISTSISVAGTLRICEEFKSIFDVLEFEHFHINKVNDNFYDLRNSSKYEFPIIVNWLYNDRSIYLKRKYETVQNILNEINLDIKNNSNDYPKWEYISGAIPDLEVPHSSKIEDDDIVYTD